LLTDNFRLTCNDLPLPDPDYIVDIASIIASTNFLEHLKCENELLLINHFGLLVNHGVNNLLELVNESRFPRKDDRGNLATHIIQLFTHLGNK
jgi:hypothetical protein